MSYTIGPPRPKVKSAYYARSNGAPFYDVLRMYKADGDISPGLAVRWATIGEVGDYPEIGIGLNPLILAHGPMETTP